MNKPDETNQEFNCPPKGHLLTPLQPSPDWQKAAEEIAKELCKAQSDSIVDRGGEGLSFKEMVAIIQRHF